MNFTLNELPDIAGLLIEKARGIAAADHATVIAMTGDLGAGKTTLSKEVARKLGVKEDLQSPTYVIYKRYETGAGFPWKFLVHCDMYRLESAEDIVKLGWAELIADPENLIIVEWPEKIGEVMPEWVFKAEILHKGEEERSIDFSI